MTGQAWLQSISPLPKHPPSLPWEDLASLLSRVADAMGYKRPRWLLFPHTIPHRIRLHNLLLLHEEQDRQMLQQVLAVDELALHRLTLHRFASIFQTPDLAENQQRATSSYPLLGHGVFTDFCQSAQATKVCAACLAEGKAYGRLYWSLQPVVMCLEHQQFLLDRCPTCGKAIPALRSKVTECPWCHGEYLLARKHHIEPEPVLVAAQTVLLQHLGVIEEKDSLLASDSDTSWLATCSPWHYFRLLDLFRHLFAQLTPTDPFLRAVPVTLEAPRSIKPASIYRTLQEWLLITTLLTYVFTSWPTHFYEWLETLQRVTWRSRRLTGIQRQFGPFYTDWLYGNLQDPAFDVLRDAFENYLRTGYVGGYVNHRLLPFRKRSASQVQEERDYVTQRQAIQLLGVTAGTVNTLIDQRVLVAVTRPYGGAAQRTLCLIEKASVDRLLKEWQELLTRDQVATLLGLGLPALRALAAAGWLCPTYGTKRNRDDVGLYRRQAVEQFVDKLREHAPPVSEMDENVIPLYRVFRFLGAGISLIDSLQAVVQGELPLLEKCSEEPWFQRLVVPFTEVKRYRQAQEASRKPEGWLTLAEASVLLGISQNFVRWLVQNDLLLCEYHRLGGGCWRLLFLQAELERFQQKYLLGTAAVAVLRMPRNTMYQLISAGVFHPIKRNVGIGSTFFLLREEVERFAATPTSSCKKTEFFSEAIR